MTLMLPGIVSQICAWRAEAATYLLFALCVSWIFGQVFVHPEYAQRDSQIGSEAADADLCHLKI